MTDVRRVRPLAGATITLRSIADPAALEAAWRALEARANGSFFQSWTWVGCLASERYDDPVLLQAERNGAVVALGLCNRRPTRWAAQTLWCGQTGPGGLDAVFVEHNGPLVQAGEPELQASCIAALLHARLPGRAAGFRRVILSGVDDAALAAARGLAAACHVRQSRLAPFLDLTALATPGDHLAGMGASTRQQLRRSMRLYEAAGALQLTRAATVADALRFLDRLIVLHTASWHARGNAGAFADPAIVRFHRTLIGIGVPRGEVDLLRVQAGEQDVGYLYNFRWRDRVCAYQSGFVIPARPQLKPGLVCHAAAIEHYRAAGVAIYDFLAGADRYKTSLGSGVAPMHWLELARPLSPRGLALWLAQARDRVFSTRRSTPAHSDSMSASAPGGRPASSHAAASTPR